MNRWIYLVVAAAFLAAGLIGIAIAQAPDVVKIEDKYPKRLKTPVVFDHKTHAVTNKIACTECHHTWKQAESKTPKKCAECHKPEDKGAKGLKSAFHKRCQGCHKTMKAQGKKTGPTIKCSDCHQKKK